MKIIVFPKKSFLVGKWAILGLKMAHLHNSVSALRIFFKFCTMKGANKYMEIILMTFPEKSCLAQLDHLGLKMAHPHNSGSPQELFYNFAQ